MKSLSTLLRITVFLLLILSGCTFPGQPPPLEPSSIPQAIIEQTQIVTNSSALTKTEVMTTLQPSLEKSTTPTLYKTVSPQKNTALINTKVSVTPQLSPENTISPTSTKMATLQPTSEVLIPTCLEQGIAVQPPEGFGLDGAIVYQSILKEAMYVLGGTPIISSEIPITGKFPTELVGFTPNERWLAYTTSSLIIGLISFNKGITETTLGVSGFYSPTQETASLHGWIHLEWINDSLIMTTVGYRASEQATNPELTLAVFDPFMGVWRNDLLTELPDRDKFGGVTISPDLSRTLYVFDDDNGNAVLGLYNRESRIRIWENRLFYDPNIVMYGNKNGVDHTEWSPDSLMVAYTGAENPLKNIPDQSGVYLLDHNGYVNQRITNFSGQYESFITYGLRWSHDSRFLAFIVSHADDKVEPQTIYVYDTHTGQYIFKCPLNKEEHAQLYWAPDSQHIVYSYSSASPMVVVDLKTGIIVQLAEQAVVSGWSEEFPTVWP